MKSAALYLRKMVGAFAFFIPLLTTAETLLPLQESLPYSHHINGFEPVFDFGHESCFPSVPISKAGTVNSGLPLRGKIAEHCRSKNFLDSSNTLHRYQCSFHKNNKYCADVYALYFEKDQVFNYQGLGHPHDWEYVVIWRINDMVTHASHSNPNGLITKPTRELAFDGNKVKLLYSNDNKGALTHSFSFAKPGIPPQNPYNRFVTPTIVTWDILQQDKGLTYQIQQALTHYNYGISSNMPFKDTLFLNTINRHKPDQYPAFENSKLPSYANVFD